MVKEKKNAKIFVRGKTENEMREQLG